MEWPHFDNLILVIILANSFCMAFYDYMDTKASKNIILDVLQDSFSVIFICEAIIKIIAVGLINQKKTYLRNWWNVIDFIIVVSALLQFA